MQYIGIVLGLTVALFWGSADTLASLSARRLGTFQTTYLSQAMGLCVLLALAGYLFWSSHLPFASSTLLISLVLGTLTGLFAAIGYFAFYRALELGPVALVSPLSATSSVITLLLSLLFLHEHLTLWSVCAVAIIIPGVVLTATDLHALRTLLRTSRYSLFTPGVAWVLVATLSFGIMDFGIGASTSLNGWFLPVLRTRIFSILFLTLLSQVKKYLGRSTTRKQEVHEQLCIEDTVILPTPRSFYATAKMSSIGKSSSGIIQEDRSIFPAYTAYDDGVESDDWFDDELPVNEPVLQAAYAFAGQGIFEKEANIRYMSSIDTSPLPVVTLSDVSKLKEKRTNNEGAGYLSTIRDSAQADHPVPAAPGLGVVLALLAGIAENAAVLVFSVDTQIALTGITAAIASSYSIMVMLFGLCVYREKLTLHQVVGIALFMLGICCLAL